MPWPDEAYVIWPGFVFAARINSSTDVTPSEGFTTSMFGTLPIIVTAAKSFAGSGELAFANAALIVFATVPTKIV